MHKIVILYEQEMFAVIKMKFIILHLQKLLIDFFFV